MSGPVWPSLGLGSKTHRSQCFTFENYICAVTSLDLSSDHFYGYHSSAKSSFNPNPVMQIMCLA
jgi:hypothetical protein